MISPECVTADSAGFFPHPSRDFFPRDLLADLRDNSCMPKRFDEAMQRIDQRLEAMGLSDREASRQAVGKPDMVRDMRRHRRLPTSERLMRLADTLGVSVDWILTGSPIEEQRNMLARSAVATEVAAAPGSIWRGQTELEALPLLGSAVGGNFGDLDQAGVDLVELQLGEVLEYLQRPASLASDKDAYALTVISDSMFPRFAPGERVAVSPRAAPSIGDDVIVQLRGAEGDDERVKMVLVKRLVRRSASHVELQQFNPDISFRVPADRIAAIHKVRGVIF